LNNRAGERADQEISFALLVTLCLYLILSTGVRDKNSVTSNAFILFGF